MYLRVFALLLKENIAVLKRNVLQAESIALVILKGEIIFDYLPLKTAAAV